LLRGKGIEPTVIEYLRHPPTAAVLKKLVAMLNMRPEDLVRKGEDLYKNELKGRTLTDAEWLQVLTSNPILIERPIAVRGDRAVLGRPPEKVLELV
jgi:arsenate reductase